MTHYSTPFNLILKISILKIRYFDETRKLSHKNTPILFELVLYSIFTQLKK